MKDTLYCPFMGGNPCMGRSCACAVCERFCGQLVWWCGLVPESLDNAAHPVPRAAGRMEYHTTSTDWDTLGGETVVGFSAILTPFSYGSEYGLLEVWTRDTQGPEGWLSAEEAMELLRKAGLA